MDVRKMYGVEYTYSNGSGSYDIFETLEDAKKYCSNSKRWNENLIPLFIFSADFNSELVYFDEMSQGWNYDDYSDTILGNYAEIKHLNDKPVWFA